MITTRALTLAQYQAYEALFPHLPFLQSSHNYLFQEKRSTFVDTQILGIFDQEDLVGLALVHYRQNAKFFKDAIIVHGPNWLPDKVKDFGAFFDSLRLYLKQQGAVQVYLHPYQAISLKDNAGQVQDLGQTWPQVLEEQGYHLVTTDTQGFYGAHYMYWKPIQDFATTEEIYQSFSNSLKRDLRKFQESHVTTRFLSPDQLPIFYEILKATSERKGFPVQDYAFFQSLLEVYGDKAKVMVAELDVLAYRSYLEDNIQHFSNRISELEAGQPSKKTKGLIRDSLDQLQSYQRRYQFLQDMNLTVDTLPLSSYFFICYGPEVTSFAGGSLEEWLNFGGSTLINWSMLQYAKENGYPYYNFYGTLEVEDASKAKGNFYYKAQFDGQLVKLAGTYTKPLNWIGKLLNLRN